MSLSLITVTNIKPTSGLFTSFQPRSKEGEEKRPACFAVYETPAALSALPDGEVKAFAYRAYESVITDCLRDAVKAGKAEFSAPALSACFVSEGKEYLITAKDLKEWLSSYALEIIYGAIASKAGLSADHVKVVKKGNAYAEKLEMIASRSLMMQDDIDAAARVLELLENNGKNHPYTDNVIQGLGRKQEKLAAYLAANDGLADDGIDF